MNFYFDESGDFALPAPGKAKIDVCAGLVVPDSSLPVLEAAFRLWERSLLPDEKENGEPKGRLLRRETRRLFFECLDGIPNLLTVPTILDLEFQRSSSSPNLKKLSEAEGLRRSVYFDEKTRNDMQILAKKIRRLGDPQFLRTTAMATCVEVALRHAILWRSSGELASSWEQIRIRIDRSAAREAFVMRQSLPVLIVNRAKEEPFMVLDHALDHPLVRNFDSEEGFLVLKMLEDLEFPDSKSEIGIQCADILANSLRLALSDLSCHRGNLGWYTRFMRHSCLGPASNLGLIIIGTGKRQRIGTGGKFRILQRILEAKRKAKKK